MQAFMVNVVLPTNSTAAAALLQQRLDIDYDTYIVVVPLGGSDVIYTRLSAQVYLQRCTRVFANECTHALPDTHTSKHMHSQTLASTLRTLEITPVSSIIASDFFAWIGVLVYGCECTPFAGATLSGSVNSSSNYCMTCLLISQALALPLRSYMPQQPSPWSRTHEPHTTFVRECYIL